MTEVLFRRFKHAQEEQEAGKDEKESGFLPLPDLILLDGGLGQVHAVRELLGMLDTDISLFGLVKDDRHRTRALIDDAGQEIGFSKTSDAFRLIAEIQEEVHRFAISYHKKLRKKHVTGSVLEEIEGVGSETRKKLLRHFKTMTAIKDAALADLMAVPGLSEKVSKNIYNFFHKTS